jgi:Subtilase family
VAVRRIDENTIEMRTSTSFLSEPFNQIYRSRDEPSHVGESFNVGTAEITITEVTPRGADCGHPTDCPHAPGSFFADCLSLGHPGHAKQCVTLHASQCMSVAAGTNGGTAYGAGKARFYYPNAGDPALPTNMCNPNAMVNAYEWLALPTPTGQGVTTVNESFGCLGFGYGTARTLDGLIEDYFARYYDVAIAKSAGNQKTGYTEPACPFTLNSTCVGGTDLGGTGMYPQSSWTNLNGPNPSGSYGERTDREEPDIALLAYPVDVMGFNKPYAWNAGGGIGTSYAAPAATALTALCKEVAGGMMSEQAMRVILKIAGYAKNVQDYNYSMASTFLDPGADWWDGGGKPLAGAVRAFCDGTGNGRPNVTWGHDPGDLSGGVPYPFDPAPCEYCDQNWPPLGGQSTPGLHAESATPPGAGDNRLYHWLFGPVHLWPGERIRVVIAWDRCPGSPLGTAPAPITTDFDVFLVKGRNPGTKRLVFWLALIAAACGGETGSPGAGGAPPADAAVDSGPGLWCGVATPDEACQVHECRDKLVYDCRPRGGTIQGCGCETSMQLCSSTMPCPPEKECLDFHFRSCFDEPCLGEVKSFCWPPD